MSNVHDIYTVRQIGNGYLVSIHEDVLIETCDPEYEDALSRLLTHLTNKLNQLKEEEK